MVKDNVQDNIPCNAEHAEIIDQWNKIDIADSTKLTYRSDNKTRTYDTASRNECHGQEASSSG